MIVSVDVMSIMNFNSVVQFFHGRYKYHYKIFGQLLYYFFWQLNNNIYTCSWLLIYRLAVYVCHTYILCNDSHEQVMKVVIVSSSHFRMWFRMSSNTNWWTEKKFFHQNICKKNLYRFLCNRWKEIQLIRWGNKWYAHNYRTG